LTDNEINPIIFKFTSNMIKIPAVHRVCKFRTWNTHKFGRWYLCI